MLAQQEVRIRERAYAIWEQEGRPEGRDWDHWIRAAREIQGRSSATPIIAANGKTLTGKTAAAKGKIRRVLKSAIS